jgi:hypothetical protein
MGQAFANTLMKDGDEEDLLELTRCPVDDLSQVLQDAHIGSWGKQLSTVSMYIMSQCNANPMSLLLQEARRPDTYSRSA